jgi:hypothetical protein
VVRQGRKKEEEEKGNIRKKGTKEEEVMGRT